jgi:hypothetical protein
LSLPLGFCTVTNGPWFATIDQESSCSLFVPDHFTLTIQGTPQPVVFEWSGTMAGAPPDVGQIRNMSTSKPDCRCCPGLKLCPNGNCVPISAPCGNGIPA